MSNCCICGQPIIEERNAALNVLEVPEKIKSCFLCASQNDTRVKGIYLGESGTSPMIICSGLYDSRIKFNDINQELNKIELEENEDFE